MSETLKSFLDDCIAATGEKGVNVAGMVRSQLPAAIRSIVLNDYTNINYALSDILGEPVTDAFAGLAKITAIKEAERQAIIAKGTLVTLQDAFESYANKIRAIQSYVDLTYSGIMPNFILDPEPTGSAIVYMRPGATGDGSSWANAMSDFIAAHASLSGSKNVIYMEEGVYPLTGVIALKANIKIYGGFKASNHAWSSRDSFTNRTILDAQLTELKLFGSSSDVLDGLTIINSRVTSGQGAFYNFYNSKNLIAQDCVGNNGAGFYGLQNCVNLIAINCNVGAGTGGGFYSITTCQNMLAINCNAQNGGGFGTINGCSGLLALNCKAVAQGAGLQSANNCTNAKIVNCNAGSVGGATNVDVNCKNFLIVNCMSTGNNAIVQAPSNCQNYTIVNSVGGYAVYIGGGANLLTANKIYNFVCFNNKTTSGTLLGYYLTNANYYYKIYNCRSDTAISFNTNAATYADIQNFSLIQNSNSEPKFINTGVYPTVGNLPYENSVINQKYINGNFGNFNIPLDSILAGAGYWEDGFSFGWDIDGKTRNATHCSIGCYEPHWA